MVIDDNWRYMMVTDVNDGFYKRLAWVDDLTKNKKVLHLATKTRHQYQAHD